MTESFGETNPDDENLHRAIDQLQVIVFDLEVLKQQPEIASTNLAKELGSLTDHVFRCSDLLHQIRNENWQRRSSDARKYMSTMICS
jgi:hypothetical protein